jgi:hypothetical protein
VCIGAFWSTIGAAQFQIEIVPMNRSAIVSVLIIVLLINGAWAEKPNMSSQALRKTATHVVTGRVVAIYERTETAGDWKYTRYVAEIRVDDSEKGDGIKKGDLIYARYWQRGWMGRGQAPPSTNGHRGLPEIGQSVRVYLARNAYDGFSTDNKDGGFNVIGANGFEPVNSALGK